MLKIALASPKPGVGKTTSAVFLAESLRTRDYDVIVIDADRGDSALRWFDLAGGLSFPVAAMQVTDLHRKLPSVVEGRDAVVIDVPQIEDHRRIAKGALRYADLWLLPVAPSGIEVDRMMTSDTSDFIEEVQSERIEDGTGEATVVVFFNRTNRLRATQTGPDADVRRVLTELGWTVAHAQIPHGDVAYRQPFGCPLDYPDPAYDVLLTELLKEHAR